TGVFHVSYYGVHAVVEAVDVNAHDAVEVFFRRALNGADVRNPSIVDKDVNTPLSEKFLKLRLHVFLVRHIATVSRSGPARSRDLFKGCIRGRLIYVENANLRALRRKFQRNGLSNATAATRDHSDFAIKAKISRVS